MPAPSTVGDRFAAGAVLGCLLLGGCRCGDGAGKRDAGGGSGDAAVGDGDAAVGGGDAAVGGGDAAVGSGDAGVGDAAVGDAAVGDAAVAVCPTWRTAPASGRGWLYARALSNGVALTPADNHVDIYVRAIGTARPGLRADADDPCAVASYDQGAAKVSVLVAAIGFSSQERDFTPGSCSEFAPCAVDLPRSLEARYYVATAKSVNLRPTDELKPEERAPFAASVASDALARSKALQRPLADELDRAEKATKVPAVDLAIHYTESTLRKKCDASCLESPALDPAVRAYLKNVRRPPGRTSPFDMRVAPDRWPIKER